MDYSSATLAVITCCECSSYFSAVPTNHRWRPSAEARLVTKVSTVERQHSIHLGDIQQTFKTGNAESLQACEEVRWRCALNEAWYITCYLFAHASQTTADSYHRFEVLVMKWRAHLAI